MRKKALKQEQKRNKSMAQSINILGNEDLHDSLMNTDLLNQQIAALADTSIDVKEDIRWQKESADRKRQTAAFSSQQSQKIRSIRGEKSIHASNMGNLTAPIIREDSKIDQHELKEPKLLKEIREARREDEREQMERKLAKLPLRFHLTKAIYKVDKAGAVAQQRAKYSGNNMQRLKLQLKGNRQSFGIRKYLQNNNKLEQRLDELHRSQKLKQQKLDKKAKDDGTGSFVPYITAKMISDAEKQANNVQNQLKIRMIQGWMKKRNLPGQHQYSDNRSRVRFAKNIFITWDKNKNGRLDVDQIADPMISLGLSKDKPFVEQVVNSIATLKQPPTKNVKQLQNQMAQKKTASHQPDKKQNLGMHSSQGLHGIGSQEGDRLTVKDFVTMFKTDKVSQSIIRVV